MTVTPVLGIAIMGVLILAVYGIALVIDRLIPMPPPHRPRSH